MSVQALVDPSISGRLCVTLLHSFWQVALLALVAWGFGRLWRRRSVERSYALHVGALVAGLVAMPITYSLVDVARPIPVDQAENSIEPSSPALPPTATVRSEAQPAASRMPVLSNENSPLEVTTPSAVSVAASRADEPVVSWLDVAPWIAVLYAVGVLVMLLRVGVSIWRAQRLGAKAHPVIDRALVDRLNALARNWSMRVVPVLARAEHIVVPKLVGLLRPTILLPTAAITGLSAGQMEMILAHELAHLRRHDMWVNLLQRLAESVLFFNPALWYLSRRISTLREYCCDEMTCRAMSTTGTEPRTRYASALLRVVELGAQSISERSSAPTSAGSDLTALAASGRSPSELRRRVARLFGEPIREPLRVSRGSLLTLSIAAMLLLTGPAVWNSVADSTPEKLVEDNLGTTDTNLRAKAPNADNQRNLATISGRIVFEDRSPATDSGWLYSEVHRGNGNHGNTTMKTEGNFSKTFSIEVSPGTVWLSYFPKSHAPAWVGPLEVTAGDRVGDVTLTLRPGSSQLVQVRNASGEPIAGATIVAHPEINGSVTGPVHKKITDETGEHLLTHLADTRYAVNVTAPGYESLRTVPTRVDPDKTLRLAMIRSQSTTGMVRSAGGTPAAGAKFYCKTEIREDGKTFGQGGDYGQLITATDASTPETVGRFSLDQLTTGSDYFFVVEADDGARGVVSDLQAGQDDVEIVIPRRCDLFVKITGDLSRLPKRRGKPFVSVRQRFDFRPAPGKRYGELIGEDVPIELTDDGGTAVFRGLAVDLNEDAGPQQVEISLTYPNGPKKIVDIDLDGETRVEFELPAKPRPPVADPDGDANVFGTQLIGKSLVVCPVTTDLQRSLLGSLSNLATKTSVCVFVNAGGIDSLDADQEQTTDASKLADTLKKYSQIDNREVWFRLVDRVSDEMPFKQRQERMRVLGESARSLGTKSGFEGVRISRTFHPGGFQWDEYIQNAQVATGSDSGFDLGAIENAQVHVNRVETFLSRLLVTADCVVHVLPIVRDSDGARFREDVLPAIAGTVGRLDTHQGVRGKRLLIRIRYSKDVKQEMEDWVNDIPGRKAFAEELGFEKCNLSQSQIAESEEVSGGDLEDKKEPVAEDDSRYEISSGKPQFELLVVGPDGKPVPLATVEIRTKPTPTKEQILRGAFVRTSKYGTIATTNREGRLIVEIPAKLKRFNVNIKHPGYGPYWAGWDSSSLPQAIPSKFTAELDSGWSVGGVVVDQSGQPIEGATIRPSIEFKKRPGDRRQLGTGTRLTTDANGRWSFHSVPDSMPEVFVAVDHPDFRPNRGPLTRSEFGFEPEQEPTAKITLEQGLVVTGAVTDESGAPIAGALVRTKFLNDLRQATTDNNGTYRLAGCEPKMARIVVSAEGKALDLKEVRVGPDMEPVDFVMKPGGHVRVRVVDEQGHGIPKASIFFQRWRGRIDYFEFDHVSRYADENGVWEWKEAPLDEFQADIYRPDGMELTSQSLIAREDEYVFRPPRALVVSGKVVDAVTKVPIKKFRVIPGLRNSDPGIRMNWIPRGAFEASGGQYRVRFTRAYPAHLVRIEAAGYQMAISRDIQTDEGEVTVNFELQPAADIASTVATPKGEPAAGAKVALGVAGSQISIKNGDIDDSSTYATRLDADETGRFSFPARDEPFQIVITHPSGYAYFKSEDGPIPPSIRLTAWTRVEGTFRVGPQAVSNIRLILTSAPIHSYGNDVPSIFTQHDVTTGKDGRFVFERVFPGSGRVGRRILLMASDGATEVTSSQRVAVQLPEGETVRIDLGGTGRPVIGRLIPPKNHEEEVLWNFALVNVRADLARPPEPQPPDGIRNNPRRRKEWMDAWKKTAGGEAWQAANEAYEMLRSESPYVTASIDRDGSFRIDDVPAGAYVLSVRFSQHPAGRLANVKFSIPEFDGERSDRPLDLGVLALE